MLEVFTVGGGEYLVNTFNAIAAWTGSGGFKSLIRVVMVMGLIYALLVTAMDLDWRAWFRWFIQSTLIYLVLMVPTVTVKVTDRINPSLAPATVANVPIGQAPQALSYVPNAVPEGPGTQNLQLLGHGGASAHLVLAPIGGSDQEPTSVSLFDQGLLQVLQASVTGLTPKQAYVLALARQADGSGQLEPLASFMTNPAGAAIVNAIGPIRQVVHAPSTTERRYLVIAPGTADQFGAPVQVQAR